mmetsp:Transcript_4884/g.11683  ORF Transcript_4884/g.11683 Transcript_4884/m.11683 type:complete len:123 (-) Transcript_4884:7-375(-)|eukprot:CAMPEP_0114496776 /NCGR_PEP_ID=MMETSP0109-20121206/5951_1 /TAXON_ID=29199 /ORGANISM="Chlorarachnion reptans, Strain CCCM449" /LENGTH=122 /DNA_ID=CAMNT_0001674073 /DNA_START=264 /DNA_END=632 /DNA_ORIENTATION=-
MSEGKYRKSRTSIKPISKTPELGIISQSENARKIRFLAQFDDQLGIQLVGNKVTIVSPESQAWTHGVRPGWAILTVRGTKVNPNAKRNDPDNAIHLMEEACKKYYTLEVEFRTRAPGCCTVS